MPVGEPEAAPVGAVGTRLDGGQRAGREELEHRGRVEGAPAREAEPDGLARGAVTCRPPPEGRSGGTGAQPARGVGEDLAHRLVALAHAGESGGERDLRDREVGRLQQDAGGLAALGAGQGQRPGSHLGGDEAIELAGAVPETAGQTFDALAVHDAVTDEAHGPRHHVGPHVPLGRAGRGVGPAAQAGPEAGLLGGGRGGVEAHVLALGRAGRATGPAVDPGGRDGAEEPAVEAGVFALRGLVAAFRVLDHAPSLARRRDIYWRKSDITVYPLLEPASRGGRRPRTGFGGEPEPAGRRSAVLGFSAFSDSAPRRAPGAGASPRHPRHARAPRSTS